MMDSNQTRVYERRCKQCGGAFIPKRKHQRFCKEQHKEQYHLDKRHGVKKEVHDDLILGGVQKYPNHTAGELGQILGLTTVQVCRRLSKLEFADKIQRNADKRLCRDSKRMCLTWREVN